MEKTGRQLFNQLIEADISKNKAYGHHLLLDVMLRRAPEDSNHPRSCRMLKCHTVNCFAVNSIFFFKKLIRGFVGRSSKHLHQLEYSISCEIHPVLYSYS